MILNTFQGKAYVNKINQNGDNIFVDVSILVGIDENKKNIYQYASFFAGDSVKKLFSNFLEHQIEVPNEGYRHPLSGVMIDVEIINLASTPWKQGEKNGINTQGILNKISC